MEPFPIVHAWRFPSPHPCAIPNTPTLAEEKQTVESDYQDLVNAVEAHTFCSVAYCLRRKKYSLP